MKAEISQITSRIHWIICDIDTIGLELVTSVFLSRLWSYVMLIQIVYHVEER